MIDKIQSDHVRAQGDVALITVEQYEILQALISFLWSSSVRRVPAVFIGGLIFDGGSPESLPVKRVSRFTHVSHGHRSI